MPTYAPHQQRVVDEKQELDVRLAALANFFLNPIFSKLLAAEQARMVRQAEAMRLYSEVLGERIDAFLKD